LNHQSILLEPLIGRELIDRFNFCIADLRINVEFLRNRLRRHIYDLTIRLHVIGESNEAVKRCILRDKSVRLKTEGIHLRRAIGGLYRRNFKLRGCSSRRMKELRANADREEEDQSRDDSPEGQGVHG
jgi:hypothetical protein